jgi:hypothetical protein
MSDWQRGRLMFCALKSLSGFDFQDLNLSFSRSPSSSDLAQSGKTAKSLHKIILSIDFMNYIEPSSLFRFWVKPPSSLTNVLCSALFCKQLSEWKTSAIWQMPSEKTLAPIDMTMNFYKSILLSAYLTSLMNVGHRRPKNAGF